ncbi:MAG: hypothetical protein LBP52_10155, partial [Burkholderiaceae bacterium]|nr:hypothetical protein [Burkholderiaceae bacterium]
MMKSSRKHGLLLAAACLLPVAAHAQDTLPPGFDVKQYRASMIASNVQMCTATSQIYPELNNNAPLKKKFCQCVYENY